MNEEYPEQVMSVLFFEPDDKVLELGSNIGRNTLVISSLLKDSSNLVTLETDSVKELEYNKKLYGDILRLLMLVSLKILCIKEVGMFVLFKLTALGQP